MSKKHWLYPLLDGVGLASLVIAIFALGGVSWFVEADLQATLITVFNVAFATAVLSFLGARAVQIALVMKHTPNPKSLRIVAVGSEQSADLESSSKAAASDKNYPRAA